MESNSVLVVGDVIFDEHVDCRSPEPSPAEGNVDTYVVEKSSVTIGGAGLVCKHIAERKGDVTLYTVQDYKDTSISPFLHGISTVVQSEIGWRAAKKVRVRVAGEKVVKLNYENMRRHTDESRRKFIGAVLSLMDNRKFDVVVISDYSGGAIDDEVATEIITNKGASKILVDAQVSRTNVDFLRYRGANVVIVNLKELDAITCGRLNRRISANDVDMIDSHAHVAIDVLDCDIVVKRGILGTYHLLRGEQRWMTLSAPSVNAVDSLGAGDAFMAAFAQHYGRASMEDVVVEANSWAAFSCTVLGTEVPSYEDFSRQR